MRKLFVFSQKKTPPRLFLYSKMPPRLFLYSKMPPARIFLFISHFTRIYLLATLPGHPRASPGIPGHPWASKNIVFSMFFVVFSQKIIPATFSVLEDAPATFSVLVDFPGCVFFYFISHFTSDFFISYFFRGFKAPPHKSIFLIQNAMILIIKSIV